MKARLTLNNLEVRAGDRVLVRSASLEVRAGRIVALVGASGSGKTLTARSLLGMVDLVPGVVGGRLEIQIEDTLLRPYDHCLGGDTRRRAQCFEGIRGTVVGYLPQEARAALDPLWSVGRQVRTAAALATGHNHADPLPWLERAGFRNPRRVAALYPHELSGGMAQRACIAQALARGSRFFLADEPTTGLDPTVQGEILREIRRLADESIGVLLITHDLRILPGVADEVLVLDDGMIVERVTAKSLRDGDLRTEPARRLYEATRRVSAGRLR